MATPQKDLKDKLRLEEQFRPVLQRYHDIVSRAVGNEYAATGNSLNMQIFEQPLVDILDDHYSAVTNEFSNRIRSELPADVRITEAEATAIDSALMIWGASVLVLTARRINGTTQDQIDDAIDFGMQDPSTRELFGREAQLNTAAIARVKLRNDLTARESGILMTETQKVAEAAKATEVEVLAGVMPSISGGSARKSTLRKEWDSVGDSVTRPAHLAADGQRVPINEPYIIDGEALMRPGDTDLGASMGNIANCRCGSNTVVSDIVNVRRSSDV